MPNHIWNCTDNISCAFLHCLSARETGSSARPLKVESWGRTLAKAATPKIFQAGGKKDVNPHRLSKPSQDFLGKFSEIQSCHPALLLLSTIPYQCTYYKATLCFSHNLHCFHCLTENCEEIVGFEKQENICSYFYSGCRTWVSALSVQRASVNYSGRLILHFFHRS